MSAPRRHHHHVALFLLKDGGGPTACKCVNKPRVCDRVGDRVGDREGDCVRVRVCVFVCFTLYTVCGLYLEIEITEIRRVLEQGKSLSSRLRPATVSGYRGGIFI